MFLFFQHQFPFKDFTTSAKFSFNLFASPMISLVTKNKPIQNPTQQPSDEFHRAHSQYGQPAPMETPLPALADLCR